MGLLREHATGNATGKLGHGHREGGRCPYGTNTPQEPGPEACQPGSPARGIHASNVADFNDLVALDATGRLYVSDITRFFSDEGARDGGTD